MAQLVRTVVYADLLVVRTEQRVIGDGIQQGDAFHLRTARLFLDLLQGETARNRRVDDQHVGPLRAKWFQQKLHGNFNNLDAEAGKPFQHRFQSASDDSGRIGNSYR